MNGTQCRMARAALGWSLADLAGAASVNARTIIRHEAGEVIQPEKAEAMRLALEAAGVRFLMNGPHRGGVVPPPPVPVEDRSGGNPLLPGRGK